jgi:hypothetical protein
MNDSYLGFSAQPRQMPQLSELVCLLPQTSRHFLRTPQQPVFLNLAQPLPRLNLLPNPQFAPHLSSSPYPTLILRSPQPSLNIDLYKPNPALSRRLLLALKQANSGVSPYFFRLDSYLSRYPDIKIYEWQHDEKKCFNLITALLNSMQIKNLDELAVMLASSLSQNSCLELIKNLNDLSENPNTSCSKQLISAVIQAAKNTYHGPAVYLIQESSQMNTGPGIYYTAITYEPKQQKYYYINQFGRDGAAQEINFRPESFQQDLQKFITHLNQVRNATEQYLIQNWQVHILCQGYQNQPMSTPIYPLVYSLIKPLKLRANFSSFKSIGAYFDQGFVFKRLIDIPIRNDYSTQAVLWQNKGPFCGLAAFLNAMQIQSLTAVFDHLDKVTTAVDKSNFLGDLNKMIDDHGLNTETVTGLAKYISRDNLKYTPYVIFQNFSDTDNHLMALLRFSEYGLKRYILLDSNTSYQPAVIYEGNQRPTPQILNQLLNPEMAKNKPYFQDLVGHKVDPI